jgi:protein-tyrosine kinase
MSLVEQAMSRMRRPGGVESLEKTDALPSPGGVAPVSQPVDAAPQSTKRLTVDINALRAGGYLPEEEKDRQFADHYRHIKRPLIQKALADHAGAAADPRLLMVTSALPGDGKTFTSINLAFSMALERDISILLVDSDVAKHHITDIFGLGDQKGLLDALTDERLDPESLVVPTSVRGFSILPAGRRVEGGTAELMSSNRMRQIATILGARNSRRILLLDSPPLLITNEGRAIVKVVGQVVLVVRAGETPLHAVEAAIGMFDEKQMGGMILNQVKGGLTEGYYGYGAYGTLGNDP